MYGGHKGLRHCSSPKYPPLSTNSLSNHHRIACLPFLKIWNQSYAKWVCAISPQGENDTADSIIALIGKRFFSSNWPQVQFETGSMNPKMIYEQCSTCKHVIHQDQKCSCEVDNHVCNKDNARMFLSDSKCSYHIVNIFLTERTKQSGLSLCMHPMSCFINVYIQWLCRLQRQLEPNEVWVKPLRLPYRQLLSWTALQAFSRWQELWSPISHHCCQTHHLSDHSAPVEHLNTPCQSHNSQVRSVWRCGLVSFLSPGSAGFLLLVITLIFLFYYRAIYNAQQYQLHCPDRCLVFCVGIVVCTFFYYIKDIIYSS